MSSVCAWCRSPIADAGTDTGTSHGICLHCLPESFPVPVASVRDMTPDQLEALPYGLIRLDRGGGVIEYNAAESRRSRRAPANVLGRAFFAEVAPCANVKELAGWVSESIGRGGDDATRLDFVFDFPFGRELVELVLVHHGASGETDILVRSVTREIDPPANGQAG